MYNVILFSLSNRCKISNEMTIAIDCFNFLAKTMAFEEFIHPINAIVREKAGKAAMAFVGACRSGIFPAERCYQFTWNDASANITQRSPDPLSSDDVYIGIRPLFV